jgi:hypothetical protein
MVLAVRLQPVARGVILSSLALISVGLLYELDLLPGHQIFTSNHHVKSQRPMHITAEQTDPSDPCAPELSHLSSLGLTSTITYSRRCVRPVSSDADRDVVANISSRLLTTKKALDLSDACKANVDPIPCEILGLPVSPADPGNHGQFTHIIFGVATTLARLLDSKSAFAHWLSDSGSTLVCLLTDDLEGLAHVDLTILQDEYKAAGMNLILVAKHHPEHSTEQSHLMVIRNMLQHAEESAKETHWLAIIDDDTFFPSLHTLAGALSSYDHTEPQYLGQLTESAHSLPMGFLGAFGGAGIFLSRPLAQILDPHLESCLEEFPGKGGDMQIMDCIYAHSFAKLKMLHGLYQVSSSPTFQRTVVHNPPPSPPPKKNTKNRDLCASNTLHSTRQQASHDLTVLCPLWFRD